MLALQTAYQQTYRFIGSKALPFLAWSELETAVAYWIDSYEISPKKICNDIFPLLTCCAVGGKATQAIPLAAYWLLNVMAARVFDDIQDKEGAEHPWNDAGLQQALPTGIALLNVADICLSHLQTDQETFFEVINALKRATALAAKAQRYPPTKTTTMTQYIENSLALTGEIFAVGAWVGARLHTSNSKILCALEQYGRNLGLKMAIVNDCLDLAPEKATKLSDLTVAAYKLPVIYAASLTQHVKHSKLQSLLHTDVALQGARLKEVVELLEEMGAIAWCLQLAGQFQQQAKVALDGLPDEIQQQLHAYV